jgi:hypothetical protein
MACSKKGCIVALIAAGLAAGRALGRISRVHVRGRHACLCYLRILRMLPLLMASVPGRKVNGLVDFDCCNTFGKKGTDVDRQRGVNKRCSLKAVESEIFTHGKVAKWLCPRSKSPSPARWLQTKKLRPIVMLNCPGSRTTAVAVTSFPLPAQWPTLYPACRDTASLDESCGTIQRCETYVAIAWYPGLYHRAAPATSPRRSDPASYAIFH